MEMDFETNLSCSIKVRLINGILEIICKNVLQIKNVIFLPLPNYFSFSFCWEK